MILCKNPDGKTTIWVLTIKKTRKVTIWVRKAWMLRVSRMVGKTQIPGRFFIPSGQLANHPFIFGTECKGHLYIVAEYDDKMRGKVIPDDQVVRAKNGRWFTQDKVNNFKLKSTPRCPTYGVCQHCFSSEPVHMLYQKCKTKGHRYV
jgi:hypothetical protein